jgi:hypothetical protein
MRHDRRSPGAGLETDVSPATRLERIDQVIERYREEKRRRLLRRALTLWRKAEADQRLATFELPPELVH